MSMNNRKTYETRLPNFYFSDQLYSLKPPRQLTDACSKEIRNMPKSYNSSAGYIINRVTAMQAKTKPSSIWNNQSAQVRIMLQPSTSKADLLSRQPRRPELVPARTVLHGPAKIPQSL